MLLNNEAKLFFKTWILFKTTHRLHSSSLFSVCLHRNFSAEVVVWLNSFPWHCNCKCMYLNLLCYNLATSLSAGCSPVYSFLTGRNCWHNGPPVITALPSSPEQHLGVSVCGERWWLLPCPWHGRGSRRSPSAPPTIELLCFQFLGQTCCFQDVTLWPFKQNIKALKVLLFQLWMLLSHFLQ